MHSILPNKLESNKSLIVNRKSLIVKLRLFYPTSNIQYLLTLYASRFTFFSFSFFTNHHHEHVCQFFPHSPITVSFSFSLSPICLLLIPRYCFFHSSTHSQFTIYALRFTVFSRLFRSFRFLFPIASILLAVSGKRTAVSVLLIHIPLSPQRPFQTPDYL